MLITSFYSSPSCDGDRRPDRPDAGQQGFYSSPSCDGDQVRPWYSRPWNVSILPRLATGIFVPLHQLLTEVFLFFPVLRRGSTEYLDTPSITQVSILPRLATGIPPEYVSRLLERFLFFPVLRRGSYSLLYLVSIKSVSILPRLATGIVPAQDTSGA